MAAKSISGCLKTAEIKRPPMIISQNSTVLFHYSLSDKSGNKIDSSPADGTTVLYPWAWTRLFLVLKKQWRGKNQVM